TGTIQLTGHCHFLKVYRKLMIRVIESNSYRSVTERLPVLRTGEDHILHAAASELFDSLLTEDPSYSVRYITLAASVRSHNTGNAIMKIKFYLVCKGFKSLHFNVF